MVRGTATLSSEGAAPLQALDEAEAALHQCFTSLATVESDQHRTVEALEQSIAQLKSVHEYFVSVQQEEATASTVQDEISDLQLDIKQKDELLAANNAKMGEWLKLFTECATSRMHCCSNEHYCPEDTALSVYSQSDDVVRLAATDIHQMDQEPAAEPAAAESEPTQMDI